MMKSGSQLFMQKNRGWRGLAQVRITNEDCTKEILNNIFSFSQDVWNDMLDGRIIVQDKDYYYILTFDNLSKLPSPTQQRSVLIKNFKGTITDVSFIEKAKWNTTTGSTFDLLYHYIKNKNNHTKSDWNYIGIRVMPDI